MVTFLVCADIHLDSAFSLFPKSSSKAVQRREEQKEVFRQVVSLASQQKTDFLLIPGDLWDQPCPDKGTISFLQELFGSIPDTRVIIAPGNHDPATPNSPYRTASWPENVTIFPDKLDRKEYLIREERVCVYGAGFTGHFQKEPLLSPLPERNPDCLNFLVLHGDTDVPSSRYNPIATRDLERCGFHFCALGHIHKYAGCHQCGDTWYGYPGIPEGRGFDEEGDCGILEGSLHRLPDGSVRTEVHFRPVCRRRYLVKEISVSACCDSSEIVQKILEACPQDDNLYKVILQGNVPAGFSVSIPALSAHLAGQYYYIKIQDATIPLIQPELLAQEHTLKGLFVRDWLAKKKTAPEGSQEELLLEEALQLGLQAFEQDILWEE